MEDSVSNVDYIEMKSNSIMLFVMEGTWQDVNADRFYFEKARSLSLHLVVSEIKICKLNGKRKVRRGREKGLNYGGWKL